MKVHTRWSDGQYWAEEYKEGHAKAGLAFVEIEEEDWRSYQDHLEQYSLWQRWLQQIDNQQFEGETRE